MGDKENEGGEEEHEKNERVGIEKKEEKLSKVWKIYEEMQEKVDHLGQSVYDFGEALKDLFGEPTQSKSTEKAPEVAMSIPSWSNPYEIIHAGISPSVFYCSIDLLSHSFFFY